MKKPQKTNSENESLPDPRLVAALRSAFANQKKMEELLPETSISSRKPPVHVEQGVFRPLETTRPTSTFAPLHYEPNYAYPLIIWLHTPGETERQIMRVMPMMSLRNYVSVAIRGNLSFGQNGLPKEGFYWDATNYETAYASVLEALASIRQRYKINSKRIYLAGCEEGGTMAQRLAFRNPECFNGVISFDGAVPDDIMLLERYRELRQLRFFYAISRGSRTCPTEAMCGNLRVLHSAGLCVSLKTYPTMGSLQLDMLRDADRWIMGGIETALK